MKKVICRQIEPYFAENHLIENIDELKREWCRIYGDTRYCKLYMNCITYQKLKCEMEMLHPVLAYRDLCMGEYGSVLGLDIDIDNRLELFTFMIKEDSRKMIKDININGNDILSIACEDGVYIVNATQLSGNIKPKVMKNLPKKYIINKGATILFWEDGTKTVVKRAKDDEYNKIMGFLWAYFQKTSGLSRTKANEYLRGLVDADELKAIELIKSGKLNETMGNVAEALGNALKNMADSFKNKN